MQLQHKQFNCAAKDADICAVKNLELQHYIILHNDCTTRVSCNAVSEKGTKQKRKKKASEVAAEF